MENMNLNEKPEPTPQKTLAVWMDEQGISDKDVSERLVVARMTVWRWRVKGVTPAPRDRESIQVMAGNDVIIIFGVAA